MKLICIHHIQLPIPNDLCSVIEKPNSILFAIQIASLIIFMPTKLLPTINLEINVSIEVVREREVGTDHVSPRVI